MEAWAIIKSGAIILCSISESENSSWSLYREAYCTTTIGWLTGACEKGCSSSRIIINILGE